MLLEAPLKARYFIVAKRVPRQVPPLNTPLYITLTMILYENIKPIEHVLLHLICTLSHLMCECKHCKLCKVIFILMNTLTLLVSLSLQKTDFRQFLIIKRRHTG